VFDEDGRPLPARPWEPPGPSPRRRLTFGRPMVIIGALALVAVLLLWALQDTRFGMGVG
jgi:hypothetical protein